ncbi:helix-turn-helix transcriptional regulator [Mycolicibacterium sp. 018/SC-01/001]|uniref:ArsR/SmtB family transcription factor n=1 Tax=Mycolicibacterium sp. 018/SC-01/001 TaxID=2592069 RepID=UPI00117FCFDD|nr:helix-turn-helix transcriptional regulator [Mycolicibacterium sp. 018/SC-01/001]TRW80013.1 helix-turn-helix transcriptional regulator [Mycolicibacterium sp. 018/SC-01/001]
MTADAYPTHPVAPVQQVLAALQDPVRLEVVRRLHNAGTSLQCGALYDGINKSTATHHFKILREGGLTERRVVDGLTHQRLRVDEVEDALPGLLASIVAGANRAARVPVS